MSLAAASKHVQVRERAGLVRRTVDGRRHVCRLDPAPLATATDWLRFHERFWNERLDDLHDPYRLFRCHTIMNCVDVCPKNLNPTRAIGHIKELMVKRSV